MGDEKIEDCVMWGIYIFFIAIVVALGTLVLYSSGYEKCIKHHVKEDIK